MRRDRQCDEEIVSPKVGGAAQKSLISQLCTYCVKLTASLLTKDDKRVKFERKMLKSGVAYGQ